MTQPDPHPTQRLRVLTLMSLYVTLALLSLMLLYAAVALGPTLDGARMPYVWTTGIGALASFIRTALAGKAALISFAKKAKPPKLDLMACTLALLTLYLASQLFEGY